MNKTLVVSSSIEINATPEKVWRGLTTPSIIKEYLFGTDTVTDWKVGFPIVFQGEFQGHKYRDHGKILELAPNKTLRYSYWSGFSGLEDKPENYSEVICSIESTDGKTCNFTWTQKGFKDESGYNHSLSGMPDFLKKVKEVIEKS